MSKRLKLALMCLAAALWPWVSAMGSDSGLSEQVIEYVSEGQPILWRDFEKAQPADALRPGKEVEGRTDWGANPPASFWGIRQTGWTPKLLNAFGTPPDLTLDPGIKEPSDIHLGLRSVTPAMSLGIKLSSEPDFTIITAPAATPTRHFDFEFHWKCRVPMSGEKLVVRALGKPLYLQYVRFVPYVPSKVTRRVPEQHVTIMQEKGRHFAFPGVAELQNGDLLVVCREGDGHVCPRGRIVMIRSTDRGKTWSPREVIHDSPSDERDPAVLCLKDGTAIISFCTWDSWRRDPSLCAKYAQETARMGKEGWGKYSGNWIVVSRDLGRTWTAPRKSPVFSPHGPVEGPDAALYWVGERTVEGRTAVEIHRSTDIGQTWTRHSEVAYCRPYGQPLTWEYWDEPHLIFLPGGKAICTMRVEVDGYVRHAYSKDDGKTWSWPKKLPVWGFPQQLCRLADGRLLMAYGYRREPHGIRACLSSDEGRTWDLSRQIVLRHEGGHGDLGYPYTIQLKDGRVFTAYYYNHKGGDCYIEGAFFRP